MREFSPFNQILLNLSDVSKAFHDSINSCILKNEGLNWYKVLIRIVCIYNIYTSIV